MHISWNNTRLYLDYVEILAIQFKIAKVYLYPCLGKTLVIVVSPQVRPAPHHTNSELAIYLPACVHSSVRARQDELKSRILSQQEAVTWMADLD